MTDDPRFRTEMLATVDGETYWRRRAEAAEAEVARLREALETMVEATRCVVEIVPVEGEGGK